MEKITNPSETEKTNQCKVLVMINVPFSIIAKFKNYTTFSKNIARYLDHDSIHQLSLYFWSLFFVLIHPIVS